MIWQECEVNKVRTRQFMLKKSLPVLWIVGNYDAEVVFALVGMCTCEEQGMKA